MRLRFASSYPTMTADQARNAITIAQVARDLEIPRYGLQIAIAAAIQESKLVNLTGGDRDSGGLFQQRPSAGWGSRAEITNPVLAARAFFGQAQQTGNPGLLDIPGWQNMPLTQAAQAVQRSGYPDAYAQWEDVAGDITDLLGGDLPDLPDDGSTRNVANCQGETINPIPVGTLNLLGAGHTDKPGERPGYDTWDKRLPGAMRTIENADISIAGLQEVHGPQAQALENQYAAKWGMYPASGKAQNRVIWDRNEWEQTDGRLVDIPYFGGKDVGMPLVQLTSTTTGQVIWVWSIHNPANTQGNAAGHRQEALRRQLATMTELAGAGTPAVILGDFNDGKDGNNSSHCALTPELSNAFGGSAEPCKTPKQDAPIDHVYGANLTWASAAVDTSTQASKIADHPLVTATTAGSSAGCAVDSGTAEAKYNLGPVKPQLTQLVNILGPMFDIKTVGGYRESATDPNGHPAGLAADFMVPLTAAGRAQGDRLAAYAKANAQKLGIDYIIWYQRIWSVARAGEGWRPMEDRGSATENHLRPAGRPRGRLLRRGRQSGARAVRRDRQPQLARDRPLLVQVAHRHRLLRTLRNHRLRRPRRHHRDRHHPALGWAAAGQGHHRRRVPDHLVRPHGDRQRQPRPDRRSRRADRPDRQGGQRLRLPPPLRGPPQKRLHLRPRQRRPLDLARRERITPESRRVIAPDP